MYRQQLSIRARQDVLGAYSWDTYISRLEKLFGSVILEQRHVPLSDNRKYFLGLFLQVMITKLILPAVGSY